MGITYTEINFGLNPEEHKPTTCSRCGSVVDTSTQGVHTAWHDNPNRIS